MKGEKGMEEIVPRPPKLLVDTMEQQRGLVGWLPVEAGVRCCCDLLSDV